MITYIDVYRYIYPTKMRLQDRPNNLSFKATEKKMGGLGLLGRGGNTLWGQGVRGGNVWLTKFVLLGKKKTKTKFEKEKWKVDRRVSQLRQKRIRKKNYH